MNVYLLNADTLTGIQAYNTGKFLEATSLRNVTNPKKTPKDTDIGGFPNKTTPWTTSQDSYS